MSDEERDVAKEVNAAGCGRCPHPHPITIELHLSTHHIVDGGRMIFVEACDGLGHPVAEW